ncbi:hypothetical protein [Prochlorococcus sp. MIT 1341]|uniref:hypothetical protein n=1 Tax=Prochlorococcus sp. MIT 1341 TaxID=3096221 RepID=UPI002A74F3EF|nr:hypothetical protein [Prochlorococcus sp. MIT 1341]
MCLEPEDWENCYEGTSALSYEQLIELDQYYQERSETSIDDELHHIVKLVMKEKKPQINGLEKSLFLSTSKKNLFLKLMNLAKSLVWFFSSHHPYRNAQRDPVEDDANSSCLLPIEDVWNL